MRQLQTYFRRKLRRVGALLAAAVIAALVASCGGDFDYKISGDRPASETRKGTGEYEALSTSSHEDVLKLQERYQAKVESEAGKK
jgi:hypothetical protein